MWKNRKPVVYFLLPLLMLLVSAGCGYSPRPLLGSTFQTIAIENLENKTYEHSLEILVMDKVRDEFIFDGALRLIKGDQADLLLSGKVTDYIFETLSYDEEDNAESYRLIIRTQLTLKDLKGDKIIWQDKIIEGSVRYILSGSLAETETQARNKALDDLAKEVIRQTLDIW